jgi:hypothetical protein
MRIAWAAGAVTDGVVSPDVSVVMGVTSLSASGAASVPQAGAVAGWRADRWEASRIPSGAVDQPNGSGRTTSWWSRMEQAGGSRRHHLACNGPRFIHDEFHAGVELGESISFRDGSLAVCVTLTRAATCWGPHEGEVIRAGTFVRAGFQ